MSAISVRPLLISPHHFPFTERAQEARKGYRTEHCTSCCCRRTQHALRCASNTWCGANTKRCCSRRRTSADNNTAAGGPETPSHPPATVSAARPDAGWHRHTPFRINTCVRGSCPGAPTSHNTGSAHAAGPSCSTTRAWPQAGTGGKRPAGERQHSSTGLRRVENCEGGSGGSSPSTCEKAAAGTSFFHTNCLRSDRAVRGFCRPGRSHCCRMPVGSRFSSRHHIHNCHRTLQMSAVFPRMHPRPYSLLLGIHP